MFYAQCSTLNKKTPIRASFTISFGISYGQKNKKETNEKDYSFF
jgi:hypothetical protein